MKNLLINFFLPLFLKTISSATPGFINAIKDALENLAVEAGKTDNTSDDIVIAALIAMINLPVFNKGELL